MISLIDERVSIFLNQLIGQSIFFDKLVMHLIDNELLKGGVIISMMWWLWFKRDENKVLRRLSLIVTFAASFIALFIARILANNLPFKIRPFLNDSLALIEPEGFDPTRFDSLSSFPSDHATFFFALAFGFFAVSKKVGYLALIYTFFIITLPRIFIGAHYLTDVIAGGFIGILVVYLIQKHELVQVFAKRFYVLETSFPQLFYVLFFIVSYQAADLFIHLRNIVRLVIDINQINQIL